MKPDHGKIVAEFLLRSIENEIPRTTGIFAALPADRWIKDLDFMGAWPMPAIQSLSLSASHSVHHRGQLSTYIRVMGGKVPSIYGPRQIRRSRRRPPNPSTRCARSGQGLRLGADARVGRRVSGRRRHWRLICFGGETRRKFARINAWVATKSAAWPTFVGSVATGRKGHICETQDDGACAGWCCALGGCTRECARVADHIHFHWNRHTRGHQAPGFFFHSGYDVRIRDIRLRLD